MQQKLLATALAVVIISVCFPSCVGDDGKKPCFGAFCLLAKTVKYSKQVHLNEAAHKVALKFYWCTFMPSIKYELSLFYWRVREFAHFSSSQGSASSKTSIQLSKPISVEAPIIETAGNDAGSIWDLTHTGLVDNAGIGGTNADVNAWQTGRCAVSQRRGSSANRAFLSMKLAAPRKGPITNNVYNSLVFIFLSPLQSPIVISSLGQKLKKMLVLS